MLSSAQPVIATDPASGVASPADVPLPCDRRTVWAALCAVSAVPVFVAAKRRDVRSSVTVAGTTTTETSRLTVALVGELVAIDDVSVTVPMDFPRPRVAPGAIDTVTCPSPLPLPPVTISHGTSGVTVHGPGAPSKCTASFCGAVVLASGRPG